ncbi:MULTISPECIES: DUF6221 family protein [Thermomonosporaceae]|uniref:DUF6221 family protein n=1 Tax=Thermomonosporaceae TaxID=2012 RepID=UPI00255AF99B|nr:MULTISPECIES: DUF6221 family protein [Thermomonosporaceae]MDL4774254.1 DUF6221 family protein [Actinomadura xylanilytica]
MNGLVEFVKARLDDDELVAQAARLASAAPWRLTSEHGFDGAEPVEYKVLRDNDGLSIADDRTNLTAEDLTHIAHHEPARALAEIEAKRRLIIELDSYGGPETTDAYYVVLRHLATVYADHPDYQDDWRLW